MNQFKVYFSSWLSENAFGKAEQERGVMLLWSNENAYSEFRTINGVLKLKQSSGSSLRFTHWSTLSGGKHKNSGRWGVYAARSHLSKS